MIQLVATDIDGTLLPEGNTDLNPEYYEMIRELTDRGVHFAVATGRPAASVEQTFGPVMDRIWVISTNGAMITKNGRNRVLAPTPVEWVREFWQDLSAWEEVDSIANTAEGTYCPFEGTPMFWRARNEYKFNIQATGGWDRVPEDEYIMMTLYHPEDAERFVAEHGLRDKWEGRVSLVATGQTWVDCLMPGIDKGSAMRALCEELHIDLRDTISFGDNLNDIPLLQTAGTGYAVSNARQEVKAAADRVIPGFEEDGVLAEIRRRCGL